MSGAQISRQVASRLAAKLAASPVLDSLDAFRMHLTPLVGSKVHSFNFGVTPPLGSNIDTFDYDVPTGGVNIDKHTPPCEENEKKIA